MTVPASENSADMPAPVVGYFAQAMAIHPPPDALERRNALLAHLLGAIGMLVSCGLLGPVLPLLVLVLSKRRTPFEMFHLQQSVLFQLCPWAVALLFGVLSIAGPTLGFVFFGILLILLGLVEALALVYAIVMGLSAQRGQWSSYACVGKYVMQRQRPFFSGFL
ncbi:MAG: DUF4870 domain-containing protein [Myxococcales bacterium]|nr:DUF4870 domain-containing protein [Myxococcales bacterium]MCB9708105.1 DUF4870 domain-containing protein [Myxococcales bacterium]